VFKSFWENAVQIAAFTSVPASQHGYGMAATDDNASASLTDAVSNFGTVYTATQESLRSNTANIMAIQGQLQMLCQTVRNDQPPPGVINYQQHPRGGCGLGQQHGCNNGGGGSYGGGRYNGGGRTRRAAVATMVVAAQTAADTALATRTQAANLPRQSSVSTTGTTAARMVVTWTTTTPVQHAPAQGETINARQHR